MFMHIKHIIIQTLKMPMYAYLVLHICAYFVHIYALWYICIYVHILLLHILAYLSLLCTYFLHFSYWLICAYSCIFGTAYSCTFVHISAYSDLHIMFAYNANLFIFWKCILVHIWLCIKYILLHINAYGLFFAYSSMFLLPRPNILINIQTATRARRERGFFR